MSWKLTFLPTAAVSCFPQTIHHWRGRFQMVPELVESGSSWFLLLSCASSLASWSLLHLCLTLPVSNGISSSATHTLSAGIVSLVVLVFFGFGVCLTLWLTVTAVFGHENLTITPTHFKIKRNLEWTPSQRDSVNAAAAAEEDLTCLDKAFCKQASGDARNLWKAEVRPQPVSLLNGCEWRLLLQVKMSVVQHANSNRTSLRKYLALLEGVNEHAFGQTLSDAENDWLVQEINAVLENIKQGGSAV